jgi:N-acetylmuramoyl-L-alanine amidase
MELFIYLIKVTGCTAAFYIVYYLSFQKLTFFNLNRWYLLSSLVLSLAVPLLHIGIQTQAPASDVEPIVINSFTETITETADPVILSQPVTHVNWLQLCTYVYLAIAALLLFKLLIDLARILYKANKYGEQQNGYSLVNEQIPNNSSFFKYIFLNNTGLSTIEKEQVIAHEIVHARKLHSLDNLFSAVLKTLLWFNPFVYLFGKALRQAHEFEVDSCLAKRYNSKNYAGLLLKLSAHVNAGLANQFSAYGLKIRITMLFNKPSAAVKKLRYLLVIPVMGALVYFLCVDKVYGHSKTTPVANFVLVLDAGHGGKNTGSIAANGVTEKYLALNMVKQIKAIAEERGIKTVLTRSDDSDISLAERLKPEGNIFVSVHVNSVNSYNNTDKYNGMLIITDWNKINLRSEKLANIFTHEMQHLNGIAIDTVTHHQGIAILRDNRIPAILIELGYLSNKSDLKYITNKDNQHDVAEKFVDAVIAYKTRYGVN